MSASLWLINLGMVVFLLLGWPFILLWLCCVPKHRAGWRQKLGYYSAHHPNISALAITGQKRVWVHAVSVGEFNAVRPVIMRLLALNHVVVVTTTTQTGQLLACSVLGSHNNVVVAYCPWDLRWAVKRACQRFNPDVMLIAETELWPNLIDVVSKRCPVVLINGRLSDRSYRGYRWMRWWMRPMLQQLTNVLAQSQADAQRYRSLGALHVAVMGNLKMDGIEVQVDSAVTSGLAAVLSLPASREPVTDTLKAPVLVLASTHPGEEAQFVGWILEFLQRYPQGRLLVVPRHPERGSDVVQLLSLGLNQSVGLRSLATVSQPMAQQVVVVDSIGELNACYALAHGAIVGGSFTPKRGGQNPLEPIAQGVPVVYGPYMANFRAIVALLQQANVGCQADCALQAGHTLMRWLANPEDHTTQVGLGQALFAQHQGVADKLMARLVPELL